MPRAKYDKDVSLLMNFYLMTHFLLAILATELLTSHFQVSSPRAWCHTSNSKAKSTYFVSRI